MDNSVKAGIIGFAVGDSLGVPVEFQTRAQLQENPVSDMRENGIHGQPKGTWSDDTSLVLATMHSLIELNGYLGEKKAFFNLADKFVAWYKTGAYTPYGEVLGRYPKNLTICLSSLKLRAGKDNNYVGIQKSPKRN
jgi:ADP-ribosylglycohydrolase